MNVRIRHLVLRYGVFVLLVLMSAGTLSFVCGFELRVKTPIHLFYDSHGHRWHGYPADPRCAGFQPGDTLTVVQTSVGDIPYIVERIVPEPGTLHMTLLPLREEPLPGTYAEGFVFVGKERLVDKISGRRSRGTLRPACADNPRRR